MSKRPPSVLAGRPNTEAAWLSRWFTAARRDGFLALLPPEAWHTLSAVLSFTSRRGGCSFTLDQLAIALGQSREVAGQRLHQLLETSWHDTPLLTLEYDAFGELAGATLAPIETLTRLTPDETPQATHPQLESSEGSSDLTAELERVGLSPAQAAHLVAAFPASLIRKQLEWLPARDARNPAALLLRAVEGDWEAPKEVV